MGSGFEVVSWEMPNKNQFMLLNSYICMIYYFMSVNEGEENGILHKKVKKVHFAVNLGGGEGLLLCLSKKERLFLVPLCIKTMTCIFQGKIVTNSMIIPLPESGFLLQKVRT